jgi:DNA-directed RNA polymerase specialized sigma24 family protein
MGRFNWEENTAAFKHADLRIRAWSMKVVEDLGLPWTEREDIASDIWTHLLVQVEKFNPERSSPETFISRVIQRRAQDIFRSWWKGKNRHRRSTISLNATITDDDGNEAERQDALGEAISDPSATREDLLLQRAIIDRRIARLSAERRRPCLRHISDCLSDIERSGRLSQRRLSTRIRAIRRILGLIE